MNRVLAAMVCLSLISCFSDPQKESARAPASEIYNSSELQNFLAQDPFAKDGYDHNQDDNYTSRHFSFGTHLPPDQEIHELAGREIWFKSAPNERFHTYYFPQQINSPIAWYHILRADRHSQRFNSFGLINDPDCCVPGQNCEQKH